jgi:C_GCAxxG_C_C family probable redox protein
MPKTKIRAKNLRTARALKNFHDGFNCAQAVLSAYSRELGLEPGKGHRVSQSFGGGMARLAGPCGAVTGALMVIGLKYGKTEAKDEAAKDKSYALAREFVRRFKDKHGSMTCLGLLGHHIGTPRGMKALQKLNFHKDICPRYVRDAVLILDRIL